jgi:hypothetical protein
MAARDPRDIRNSPEPPPPANPRQFSQDPSRPHVPCEETGVGRLHVGTPVPETGLLPIRNMRIERREVNDNPWSRHYRYQRGGRQDPVGNNTITFNPTTVSVISAVPSLSEEQSQGIYQTFTWSLTPFDMQQNNGRGSLEVPESSDLVLRNFEMHFTSDERDLPGVPRQSDVLNEYLPQGLAPLIPNVESYNFAKALNELVSNNMLAYNNTLRIEQQSDEIRQAFIDILAPLKTSGFRGSNNPGTSDLPVLAFLSNIFAPIDDGPNWPYDWRPTFNTDCQWAPGGGGENEGVVQVCTTELDGPGLRNQFLCSIFGPEDDRQCRLEGRSDATWYPTPRGRMPVYFDLSSVDQTRYTGGVHNPLPDIRPTLRYSVKLGNLSSPLYQLVYDENSQPIALRASTTPACRIYAKDEMDRLSPLGFADMMTSVRLDNFTGQPLADTNNEEDQRQIGANPLQFPERRLAMPGGPPDQGNVAGVPPLASLLEIIYALMGSHGPDIPNYTTVRQILARRFGTVTPAAIYQALGQALQRTGVIDGSLEQEIARRVNGGYWKEYEYYNFEPPSHFGLDYQSYFYLMDVMNDPSNLSSSAELAGINPEYNYYQEEYEKAISSPDVPEAVLPNMYVYSLITDPEERLPEDRLQGDPPWNDPNRREDLSNNFDRLITMGEFERTSLPSLRNSGESRELFEEYLRRYAAVTTPGGDDQETAVTLDFMSDLAQQYYNITTPSDLMQIYDRINSRKNMFPMYIETSFPTAPIGEIGRIMEETTSSTSLVRSYMNAPKTRETLYMSCNGFVKPEGERLDLELRNERVLTSYAESAANIREPGSFTGTAQLRRVGMFDDAKIITDWTTWFNDVSEDIEVQELDDRFGGWCPPGIANAITIQTIRNRIEDTARSAMLTFSDVVYDCNNGACSQEVILYKLTKYYAPSAGDIPPEIVQNYYFPISSKTNLIKFVDTQVKYNKDYRYELSAVSVVYGSKFSLLMTDWRGFPVQSPSHPFGEEEDDRCYIVGGALTTPNIKIIEYPLFSEAWKRVSAGALSYPDVKVYDRPPPPPQILVAPYFGNYRQVLLAMQPGEEEFTGPRAIPWIMLDRQQDWGSSILPSILYQKKFENFSLVSPNLEFTSESRSEVKKMEIYRSTTIDETITSVPELYVNTFSGNLHKVLDISGNPDIPPEDTALSFEFLDDLQPNVRYYYAVRSVDVHGKVSNPTPIYQVELVYVKGTYYPRISVYDKALISNKSPTKKMTRFLEIKSADIQSAVKNTYNNQDKIINSEKGFISEADNQVESGKFLIRLTSRDTGRKIQFGIKFERDMTTDDT